MKIKVKEMALISIFTALTAVGAFISIPIGPVPITLQSLFVLLSGMLLGPKLGALSQIVYITLSLIGIPIFSGFSGGPQILLKPSFGFSIGFVFAAYIVGKITHGNIKLKRRAFIGSLIGSIVIYLFGLPYMYYILNIVMEQRLSFGTIINMGCLLFIPGDLLKLVLANVISKKALPILNI
ncbi:biotin transporter BioY [Tissierella sp. Yu-01]|uniref:biotin transporter BioY n=1 Tax=Tissierella sp. Yu-01 TaxID=3035694 RepID=UPI00240CEAEB|nr:biotin transporter BioY [Tissierella sp. Yu-01]WFA07738.1 biotin transporter BioY [Tissierella sp. Yu-01]